MGIEVLSVIESVATRLKADSALSTALGPGSGGRVPIFASIVPEDEGAKKWVVFDVPSSRDVNGVGGIRAMQRPSVWIKVCGEGTGFGGLKAACDRVDALMIDPAMAAVISGVAVRRLVRDDVMTWTETKKNLVVHVVQMRYSGITHGGV